jgi:hypothetical protein
MYLPWSGTCHVQGARRVGIVRGDVDVCHGRRVHRQVSDACDAPSACAMRACPTLVPNTTLDVWYDSVVVACCPVPQYGKVLTDRVLCCGLGACHAMMPCDDAMPCDHAMMR